MNNRVFSGPRAPRGVEVKIVLGALAGAAVGLLATTVVLRSFEFGILAAAGGALAGMFAALGKFERGDV
jgi:hypothetical protein